MEGKKKTKKKIVPVVEKVPVQKNKSNELFQSNLVKACLAIIIVFAIFSIGFNVGMRANIYDNYGNFGWVNTPSVNYQRIDRTEEKTCPMQQLLGTTEDSAIVPSSLPEGMIE